MSINSKIAWVVVLYYSPVIYFQLTLGISQYHKDFEQSSFHPYRMARLWAAIFQYLGLYPYLSAFRASSRFRKSCVRYKSLEEAGSSPAGGAPKCLLNIKYGRGPYLCGLYLPKDYRAAYKVDFVVVNFYGIGWNKFRDGRKYTAGIAKWALEGSRCAVIIPEYRGCEPIPAIREDFYSILHYATDVASKCCKKPRVRVICHSAGAQIFSTILIWHLTGEKICSPLEIVDRVVFMSGVYNAPEHYLFESKRGVEGISMLHRVLGGQDGMKKESMVYDLRGGKNFRNDAEIPQILVVHGDIDQVVPLSQSWEFFSELRKRLSSAQFYMARSADHLLPFHLFSTTDSWRCDPQLRRVMSEFLLSPTGGLSKL